MNKYFILALALLSLGCANSGQTFHQDDVRIDTLSENSYQISGHSNNYNLKVTITDAGSSTCKQSMEFDKMAGLDASNYHRPLRVRVDDFNCKDGILIDRVWGFRTDEDKRKTDKEFYEEAIFIYNSIIPIHMNNY